VAFGMVAFVLAHPLGLVFLVVVSEIMLYFKLDNINNDQDLMKIITKIKHSLSKISDPQNLVMTVTIRSIVDDDSTMIPKLEHKKV
jgi:hypothetical protein